MSAAAALVLVVVIAAALVGHTSRMLLGDPDEASAATPAPGSRGPVDTMTRSLPRSTAVALVVGLVAAAVLGTTTGPLSALVAAAADTLSGAP